VTIRHTLLRAFLLVGLAPAILLAGLAFVKARQALQAEIELKLAAQAGTVAANIEQTLFERLQNAAVWSQFEIMQDLAVGDVDKRLSSFLAGLRKGYGGVYRALHALDAQGKVIASSEAEALGSHPPAAPAWQTVRLAGTELLLEQPRRAAAGTTLAIRAPVPSRFQDGLLGTLVLELDWDQVEAVLDRVAGGSLSVALLDREGRLVAASQDLRQRGLLLGRDFAAWGAEKHAGGAFLHEPEDGSGSVIVGVGRPPAAFAGFHDMDLSTLVIQPRAIALAPVQRMALISLAVMALLVLGTLAMAAWVSGVIARPIAALTAFTRRYREDRSLAVAPPAAGGEVGELTAAYTALIHDIERSRRDLVRASKLAVVGEMSSVIAHEVRTPLGILRSSAQMLQREAALSAEGRELVGFIDSETERLNRLVSTMLDSARPRAPRFAPTDLHALIRKSLGLLSGQAEKKRIRFDAVLEAVNPEVAVDAEQCTQVMLNLLLNGIQILAEGGRIRVSTRDSAEEFTIDIADDGPGIPPAERSRVFEAFFFRREGGMGLGLAIVQQIVAAHGGSIEAGDSELGGALFRIRLPRRSEES